MKLISIYYLQHPATGEIFYIGATLDPKARLKSHSKNPRTKTGVEILEMGLIPVMGIITECSQQEAKDSEEFWIKSYIKRGHTLENKYFKCSQRGDESTRGRPTRKETHLNRTIWIPTEIWHELDRVEGSKNTFIIAAITEKLGKKNSTELKFEAIKTIVNE